MPQALTLVAVLVGLLLLGAMMDAALAQSGPFGAPRPQAPLAAPTSGVIGWVLAKQAEFYRQFSGIIRASKADGSAVWGLFGLSFLYGMFHAAGPGHGKAVISSYLIANEETWRRGVVLSFASALLQALVAVAIVGVAAALLNATAATMKRAVDVIEIVSYLAIIWIGLRLLVVKCWALLNALLQRDIGTTETAARSLVVTVIDVLMLALLTKLMLPFVAVNDVATIVLCGVVLVLCLWLLWSRCTAMLQIMRRERRATAKHHHVAEAHATCHEHHGHAAPHEHVHDHHADAHNHAHDCGHDHAHGHAHAHHHHGCHMHEDHVHEDDASAWGHAHAPEPEQLAGPGGWRRGLSAIVAVGLRPCSGAILVLVFALAQGLFWAGVVSTFIMGLGTAITVAIIATIAVGAKAWAGHLAKQRFGYGMLMMRAVEVAAAAVIITFGALLLTGYMVSERLVGM
ncbi:MAG: nickel/cobalt transporter [Xanthobacteraceae bacterium]